MVMDQIASLMARGLISPGAAQGIVQQVNDIRNKPDPVGNIPVEGSGGRGVVGGASGTPKVAISPHADRLLSSSDWDNFNSTFGDISKLSREQVEQVARDYKNAPTGATHPYKFKSKQDALDFIRKTFTYRKDSEYKRSAIDKLFGGGRDTQ